MTKRQSAADAGIEVHYFLGTQSAPQCGFCGTGAGLRMVHDGCGRVPAEYTCEACFTPRDDGPCFDDLQSTTNHPTSNPASE